MLRQQEAITGRLNCLKPRGGNLVIAVAHQNAPPLIATAADTAAQLMKGGQAEPLCLEDHHDAGGGHINTYLNHRGADEHVGFASNKGLHRDGTLCGPLLPMNDADSAMREALAQQLRLGFDSRRTTNVQIIIKCGPLLRLTARLCIADARDHHKCLSPCGRLFIHKGPDAFKVGTRSNGGADRLAAGGELAKFRRGNVGVEELRDGARDRCRGHQEQVRFATSFGEEFRPLLHAEAVLLVHDDEAE